MKKAKKTAGKARKAAGKAVDDAKAKAASAVETVKAKVSGAKKPATLETGAVVQVPLFVETGDRVKVDTRTGEYLTRV